MSFSYSYNPKVAMPWLSNDIPQMRSNTLQAPFYFGGSQIPSNAMCGIPKGSGSNRVGGSIHPDFPLGMPHRTLPFGMRGNPHR